MNNKQKTILFMVISIVLLSMTIWLFYGGEIFTKSQVLIETKDELFGWTEKKWVDKFVWGLDLSLLISGLSILIGGFLFWIFRNKNGD